jgi:hypothetical protein
VTTAVANAPAVNSQGAGVANMNAGETQTGNQPPVVVNTPPVVVTPPTQVEQQQAVQDAQNKPKLTQEQEAAAAEAARVDGMDIGFIEGDETVTGPANAAIQLMKDAGLKRGDANKVFGKAFESGDPADIDQAYLASKVGAQKAALILAGIMSYNTNANGVKMAAAKAVMDTVGGKENWAKVRTWAKALEAVDTGFAKKLGEYRQMIDLGGIAAAKAAEELKRLYEGDPKNSSLSRTVVQGDGTVARIDNPITDRKVYVKLLKQAHAKNDMAEVAQIEARRRAGRAQS